MKPDGTIVRDLNAFGDSWKVTDRQSNGLRSFQVPHTVHRWDSVTVNTSVDWTSAIKPNRVSSVTTRREVETDPDSGFQTSDCSSSQLDHYNSKMQCGALSDTSGPFAACHSTLPPQIYQE